MDHIQKGERVNDLADSHRNEFHASGITDETIAAAGVRTVAGAEVRKILGWQPKDRDWGTGWAIPFGDGYLRVKLDHARFNGRGKQIKYESPRRAPNRAFFAPNFGELSKGAATIVVTEGEKKALAVSQLGYPCIGLAGVWGFAQARPTTHDGVKYGRRRLIPDLADVTFKTRDVVVCFDSDSVDNSLVRMAECKLAEALTEQGAKVRVARLPQTGDAKVGADDFIVANGKDAFRTIIDIAKPAEKPDLSRMATARAYREETFIGEKGVELTWWQSEFYRWTGTRYRKLDAKELSATVLMWMDGKGLAAIPRQADDVTRCLGALCREPFEKDTPCLRAPSKQ